MSQLTILCVDPKTNWTAPLDGLVEEPACQVLERETLAAAQEIVADRDIDCLVTEYELPDGTGLELISHVREVAPDTGVIICTDADRELIAAEANDHVVEFVKKDSAQSETRIAQLTRTTAAQRSQTAYPLPATERERLTALEAYNLNAQVFLPVIQRITDLAAVHFDVTQSSVNIITEQTQEFLACHGENWETTPREQSLCTYTILSEGVTVIEDTRADSHFGDSELLQEFDIRFYAGATLTTKEGYPIGTVCIYDDTPREFTDEDEAYLELLAAEVMDWLTVLRQRQNGAEMQATRPADTSDDGGR
ncbi:GAF domain-containing protein [Haloarcula amylovorans]|uniref:GAF domain-containing protein n=1 Tax=Haloarcula amylovorans TaxID=2562280 RepID=UPI001076839B|nr:GAF domain-containing protein [Halomicroarcula amylolytica]